MENGSMYQIVPLLFVKVQKHPENFATFNKITVTNITIITKKSLQFCFLQILTFQGRKY